MTHLCMRRSSQAIKKMTFRNKSYHKYLFQTLNHFSLIHRELEGRMNNGCVHKDVTRTQTKKHDHDVNHFQGYCSCIKDRDHLKRAAPNDTAYKRWSCHSGLKLLCKLCRTSPPPAMGPDLPLFWACGHVDPLDGWRCCSQKRVMSRPIQVRQL